MSKENPNCKNCKFCAYIYNGKNEVIRYECWRFPPQVIVTDIKGPLIGTMSKFPNVMTDGIDWCHEYKKHK
jgi:hypothetical protein